MYIDQDGETILETLGELRDFINETKCPQCKAEAKLMWGVFNTDEIHPVRIVFTTTCEHQ